MYRDDSMLWTAYIFYSIVYVMLSIFQTLPKALRIAKSFFKSLHENDLNNYPNFSATVEVSPVWEGSSLANELLTLYHPCW